MKREIIALALLFQPLFAALNAQVLLGGNFNILAIKESKISGTQLGAYKMSMATLAPRLAFISGDQWYGFDVGVTAIKTSILDQPAPLQDARVNLFSASPFFRYLKKTNQYFGIWIEAQAGAGFGNETKEEIVIAKYVTFNAGLRPGVLFAVGKHLSFEISFGRFGYTQVTREDVLFPENRENRTDFGFSLNSNKLIVDAYVDNVIYFSNGFTLGANWQF